jgi:hypothetical protein
MIGMIRWSICPTTGTFCLIPFVLAACTTAVAAQSEAGVELANPAEENRVVISGAVQKGQAFPTFSGNILLKTAGKDRVELRLRSTSLELDGDPRVVINRGDVSIPAGTTIEPGQARDVRITIANVSRPGLYRGKVRFWAAGADENKALEVPGRHRRRAGDNHSKAQSRPDASAHGSISISQVTGARRPPMKSCF